MNRIHVRPELLTWARERAGLETFELTGRFPKLGEWEDGELQPTLKQLEKFAQSVHVPIGYLFLAQPPEECLPVPDFRTLADRQVRQPSPNLLDTLYLCQQRQGWYRDYAREQRFEEIEFIGSAQVGDDPIGIATRMREALMIHDSDRAEIPTWSEALRELVGKVEEAGVLVMASSVVGSNSHRKLDVGEFRGFVLADSLAPLIFLNAADTKSAQMFTLAHELVHLWLGESGLSDTVAGVVPKQTTERWCNSVAAEFLVPLNELAEKYRQNNLLGKEVQRLARVFKVSTLVILRRLFEASYIDRDTLWHNYNAELDRLRELDKGGSGGGDYYLTLWARTGKRFARAVLSSTLEGRTLYTDAFRMMGMRQAGTLHEAARKLGV